MKLTIVILIVACLQVSAKGYSQFITLSEKSASLEKVFNSIKQQSGYVFFYNYDLLKSAGKVSIDIKGATLTEALDACLKDQFLDYHIENQTIVITGKPFIPEIDVYQPITITGKVTDSRGEPLTGVFVIMKSTGKGDITDSKGNYMLNINQGEENLIFSYVGMKKQEVKIGGRTVINVIMEDETLGLDEVIVTGYQRIEKDKITGATATINTKQYQQRVAVTGNFLESLEGKVAGLVYNAQTGDLTIRGVSTFNAVNKPLIVLDGFPTELDLQTINPNDVISVNVLRDAAATSIYGVRASNGVIVIETRRGKSGKPSFKFSATYAIQDKPDFGYLNYAPANEFVQLQTNMFNIAKTKYMLYQLGYYKMDPVEEILFGKTQLSVSNPLLTEEQAAAKLAQLGSYDNLKEYKRLFYQKREAKNINFEVSGGNESSTYLLGLNYINELPVNRKSENNQLILNMASTVKLSKWLNFDFKGNYYNTKCISGNTPSYTDFFPYEHLADENGNALAVSLFPYRYNYSRITKVNNDALMAAGLYDNFYYPYQELKSNTNTTKGSSIRFQGRLNVKMTDWLNMDVGGNFENQNTIYDRLQMEDAYAVRTLINSMALKDATTGKALFSNIPKGNILTRTSSQTTNYTVRGQLNFSHKFGNNNHDFSGILGIEQKKILTTGYTTTFFGYDPQKLISNPINMNSLNATTTPAFPEFGYRVSFKSTNYFNETETDRRFMSYYGQGTYIYKSKYVATGSFRIDQSNLFGADPKYKNKPLWSAGLNWRLGQEEFFKHIGWIDNLQLRVATGFNGNVPSSNNGAYLILTSDLNTILNTPLTYNDVSTPENQSLRWETTKNYNAGLDFAVLNGRFSGSADWYLKKTIDVFGLFDADPTTGFNQYNANTASIQNKGLEIVLNSLNIRRDKFEWRTQVTASFNNNKVLAVKATEYSNSQLITSGTNIVKGLPVGAMYSYNYGGLNSMGQPYVLDRQGNKKVLAFYGTAQVDVKKEDLIYNGTTIPKYVLGLNNQFEIGSFDISFLFMYYGGHVMRVEQPNPNDIVSSSNNPLKGSINFWRQTGDEKTTIIPGFVRASSKAPGYYQSYALYGYQYASQFVRKADYIRLRDVVITYNANIPLLTRIGLKNTQLRFQAQNAFRFTFSGNDVDPEAINRVTGVRTLETQPFYSITFSTNL